MMHTRRSCKLCKQQKKKKKIQKAAGLLSKLRNQRKKIVEKKNFNLSFMIQTKRRVPPRINKKKTVAIIMFIYVYR